MEPKDEPLFRVTRGTPGPEELAALTAVLLARGASRAAAPGTAPQARPRLPRRRTAWFAPGAWQQRAG
ncbi:acyl-CoA carboxylase epsilon subunit [Streptomyces sp. NBC_01408]|uniref:acyl-CoA carboxylase epsilon subunit n=1 Tax=Streptomyces sp. NBC_01408 TaxID=2903855 RepID=UPI0022595494|nr:acyl-CoA carboxylase epsilon subunit [Streptomyces sp. NBC_01408]MCX4693178.1 acyl-CoA carboxylase epsilon subunit [Streptomyces sp. NBC_01408]